MKAWLDDDTYEQVKAIETYALRNDKLLAIRDRHDRLLTVGLSLSALANSTSKSGFKYYQCVKGSKKVYKLSAYGYNTDVQNEIISNNYTKDFLIYRPAICVYEGIFKSDDEAHMKNENYWYNKYEQYLRNPDMYAPWDTLDKSYNGKNRGKIRKNK